MGAEFQVMTVNSTNRVKIKKQFKSAQETDLYDNGHFYSGGFGMAPGLEFNDSKTFETYDEAEQWLLDNAQKWENAIAVPVKDGKKIIYAIGAWCSC